VNQSKVTPGSRFLSMGLLRAAGVAAPFLVALLALRHVGLGDGLLADLAWEVAKDQIKEQVIGILGQAIVVVSAAVNIVRQMKARRR
jgi:hypothetical protein